MTNLYTRGLIAFPQRDRALLVEQLAKLLHPDRPVLLLSGDGAIGFTIAELEPAVRHKVPIVVVVADDQVVDSYTPPDPQRPELYDEAARLVVESGQASISYLQRRLRIGFSRAARLVDMMEADGLVSPAAGSKPREVLKRPDWLREVQNQMR